MIVIVAGEGGHFTQAKRLICSYSFNDEYLHISDNVKSILKNADKSLVLLPLRNKYKVNIWYSFKAILHNLLSVYSVLKKNKVSRVISTGPGISIPVAVIAKLLNIKVIHIETWSRFRSKSITGRLMYIIADDFIVQHKCLLSIYPKAIYGGLL